jgi:hypothetical protein
MAFVMSHCCASEADFCCLQKGAIGVVTQELIPVAQSLSFSQGQTARPPLSLCNF